MKLKLSFYSCFLLFTVLLLSFQCGKEKGNFCTMEFRTITIRVVGDSLDDFFTIRNSTGDTLRHEQIIQEEQLYNVLDDGFHNILIGMSDEFTFVGILDGEKVVDELFVIEADKCHVNKVSGVEEVVL